MSNLFKRLMDYMSDNKKEMWEEKTEEEKREMYRKVKGQQEQIEDIENPEAFFGVYESEVLDYKSIENNIIIARIDRGHKVDVLFYNASELSYKQYQLLKDYDHVEIVDEISSDEFLENITGESVEELTGMSP